MKSRIFLLLLVMVLAVPLASSQADQGGGSSPASSEQKTKDANITAYIDLLRQDFRTKKALIIAEVMRFNSQDAAAFWPIYKQYETELKQLNDQKLAAITDYATNYDQMTDDKADALAQKALSLEEQRNELKKKYYEQVKTATSASTAARFLQVENQLLMVGDLQVASQLPIVP